MYFKKLEIFGFKSFADKAVMNFGPGITAVVGPNGCGKSNVFDAIRWVLGEQSVKELRGSSMEDVIFNGTDKKPSLGFAEVSLTFCNESRVLPIEFNEVTVTRRLFRSGESEYLLNKAPVRLKDILELFMGTGIGAEAYSLVQQGKVDLVVSAKPEERRIIIDEASGITKYKSRKKEALNRLRDTENNLLRINDIITEVKRQISTLERQANKARRYKEEFEKLKELEVSCADVQVQDYVRQRQQLLAAVQELREKDAQLTEDVGQLQQRLEDELGQGEDLDEKINNVTADDIKAEGQLDIRNKQIGFNEERIEDMLLSQRRLVEQRVQLDSRFRVQKQKMEELYRFLNTVDTVILEKRQQLQARQEELQEITFGAETAQAAIGGEEEKILTITAKQVQVRNTLTETMKEVQGSLARKRRLEMENAKVTQEKMTVDQKLQVILQQIDQNQQELLASRSDLSVKTEELSVVQSGLSVLSEDISELDRRKLFLISQKEFIEKLRVQYQDIPDPVARGCLVTDCPPEEHHTGIIGKVTDVRPLPDDRRRMFLQNSPEWEERPLYEMTCETKFIELDPLQVSAKIDELSGDIVAKEQERDGLQQREEVLKDGCHDVELKIQEKERERSVYESQKNDVMGETSKLTEELDLVQIELQDVAQLLENLRRDEESFSVTLDALSGELNGCQTRIQEAQEALKDYAQRRETVTVTIAQLQSELASEEEKKNNFNENVQIFRDAIEEILKEILRRDAEEEELLNKKQQYEQDIVSLQEGIVQLQEERQSLQGILSGYERQKQEVLQKISNLRSNIAAEEEEMEAMKNRIHNFQLEAQDVAHKEKEIKDRLLQSYRIDFDETLKELKQKEASPEGPAASEPIPREELLATIERLRKRCDAFGSVNLVAIEEFEELKQRFEFLTKQQSDLISAKQSLHQTIGKINRQTRQMFMDTFTKVSEEFRIYFRMLFGGGEAQLVLIDPENVLESGIEIIARPPGKKLQNINLLSGGEKTLTAIALIFGVFKVNPSPFCVLDEIDAALDESNVGRFSYLLKDFAKIAQFIVITHNKKTIAAARVMYGITMQETGVSKVVSVKFAEEQEAPEARNHPVATVGV